MTPRVRLYAYEEAQKAGVDAAAVFGRGQTRAVQNARRAVMRRLRDDGFSYTQIGGWLNRDAGNVCAAVGRAG